MLEMQSRVDLSEHPKLRQIEYVSPFRYPGGKAFLSGYLQTLSTQIRQNEVMHYAEPFCGGAGAAMVLLSKGVVDHLHLNDADVRVYSAWKAILEENQRFVERLLTTSVDMENWTKYKEVVDRGGEGYSFELGFATFFINRTSRAGIITGSGPIGGYSQNSKWKVDVRYYRSTIADRVRWIGENRDRISFHNLDGITFLRGMKERLSISSSIFFIDPPYVKAGNKLYFNDMSQQKHVELSKFLNDFRDHNWILTYDDDPLIRFLYQDFNIKELLVNYSLRSTRKECEILVENLV